MSSQINISDAMSMLASNLSAAEQEMLLAQGSDSGAVVELYQTAAAEDLRQKKKAQAFECLLQAAARAQQIYQHEQALQLYTKALELLDQLPNYYRQYVAPLEARTADVAFKLAKSDVAVTHYLAAIEMSRSTEEQAVCYRKLSEVYCEQADWERALSYLNQGLNLLSDEPSTEHARIYNGIGTIYFHQTELSKAEQQFYLALEVLSDVPDDNTLAVVYKNLANVYYLQGWLSDAVFYYERSLWLGKRSGDSVTQAKVYNNLGTYYQKRNDLSQAIDCYQQSLKLREQNGDVAGLAPLYANLGILYSHQGDFDQAVEFCQRAIELSQRLGNPTRVSQSYADLGAVYARQKQFIKAIDAYHKSLQLGERIGDVRVVASMYVNLAEAYCGEGNLSAAYKYYCHTMEVLKAVEMPEIRAQSDHVLGLIHSQQGQLQDAIEALQRASALFEAIRNQGAVEISQAELGKAFLTQMKEKLALQQELNPDSVPLVGESKEFVQMAQMMAKVANRDISILLCGETGTGKSLLAHLIHQNSKRNNGPWVEIDCGALAETLLESELFGHERGAFTSALSAKPGKFELADHGTIFLDEIGNMSPALQQKLLRLLQDREFERVGGRETLTTDVRIITATNKDLERLVKEGQFREDLYYRIQVVSIRLPPLRERETDIPLLAEHFVAKYSAKYGKQSPPTISAKALDRLVEYSWPGNVRELENVIQQAVLMTNSDVIHPEHLPEILTASQKVERASVSVGMTLKEMEQELILRTLQQTNYNVTQSAKILGISRRTLQNKRHKYKLCQAQ